MNESSKIPHTGPFVPLAAVAFVASLLVRDLPAQALTTLYTFTGSDGDSPQGLILSNNTLYGSTAGGGNGGNSGTVFSMSADGSSFHSLYSFSAPNCTGFLCVNTDGINPYRGLVLLGNVLYGTAWRGGNSGDGTVFAMNGDGTAFTVLYSFSPLASDVVGYPSGTNTDGGYPYGPLVSSGSTLYGTASTGGDFGNGTVFALSTDGTSFSRLHNFTNADGAGPIGWFANVGDNTVWNGFRRR